MLKQYRGLLFVLLLYLTVFSAVDHVKPANPESYSPSLPLEMHQILSGYLHQINAERLLIKVKVFLGGLPEKSHPESYLESIHSDFSIASTLHPQFMDTYYIAESSMAWSPPKGTAFADNILKNGIESRPDQWILPFFTAFNSFYLLKKPLDAIEPLQLAVDRGGPKSLSHLIIVLSANGGDIRAALFGLKVILASEDDPFKRKQYLAEMDIFNQALSVLHAIEQFKSDKGRYPVTLNQLIPDYIIALPDTGKLYEYQYKRPKLSLVQIKKRY